MKIDEMIIIISKSGKLKIKKLIGKLILEKKKERKEIRGYTISTQISMDEGTQRKNTTERSTLSTGESREMETSSPLITSDAQRLKRYYSQYFRRYELLIE